MNKNLQDKQTPRLCPTVSHFLCILHDFEVVLNVSGEDVVLDEVQKHLVLLTGHMLKDVAGLRVQDANSLGKVMSL